MPYSLKIAKGDAKKSVARKRRHIRVRKRVNGTAERPRLVITRSNRHIVARNDAEIIRASLEAN